VDVVLVLVGLIVNGDDGSSILGSSIMEELLVDTALTSELVIVVASVAVSEDDALFLVCLLVLSGALVVADVEAATASVGSGVDTTGSTKGVDNTTSSVIRDMILGRIVRTTVPPGGDLAC
jgi:hypothetical protein